MIEALLGSINRERVLIFLHCREEGYAREMARFFGVDLNVVQKQIERLEEGNIIYGKTLGKTRTYKFNPRYPFLKELKQLLDKVLQFYPEKEMVRLSLVRKRPRRKGKPL